MKNLYNRFDFSEFYNKLDVASFIDVCNSFAGEHYKINVERKAVEELLVSHAENKFHIYKLFGEKLKVKKEVDTSISSTEAETLLKDFIEEGLPRGRNLLFLKVFARSLSPQEFIENKVLSRRKYLDVTIEKGTRVTKAMGLVCPPDKLDEIQTIYSMYQQKTKTKGNIVLSIDPIDYITMSINKSGWRSCHRIDGGEYAAGPIAYLGDSSTVICYLESRVPCRLNNGTTFSNKSWRQIALVNPNLSFSIQEREYPNINSLNTSAVAEMFRELFEKYNGVKYEKTIVPVEELCLLHEDFADNMVVSPCYYNDINNRLFEEGYVVKEKGADVHDEPLPNKGAEVYCLCCGDVEVGEANLLFCEDCIPEEYYDDEEW